ncbi:recombinase RecT [uncultured Maritimibacter sp.]|uniref:recombinase RecT n=1 Tax=uncultured Maritimibacter sp. TaxID=991866 RepID=UPI0025943F8F|nr:recombinase RecT [uncultured Maritimibacter sp.]
MGQLTLPDFKKNLGAMIERGDLGLPSNVPPDAFRNAAILAFQNNPSIRACTPESVFNSIRDLAGWGLVPDGREAAIVPYAGKGGMKAQAAPMYVGMIKAARRSGEVKTIWADVVYEGEDVFIDLDADGRSLRHVNEDGSKISAMKRGRGKEIIGAYACAILTDGTIDFETMDMEQIEKRRKASPNQKGDKPTGIWLQWFDEMVKKTVIRALCKRLPMSADDRKMILDRDPTFQDVATKDVTPTESTEERLLRHSRERAEPTKEDQAEAEIEDAEVMAPEFDKSLVSPMDKAFDEGVAAFEKGIAEDGCPYETNPEFSQWIGGHRQAADFAKEREALDGAD